jgi:ribosomal protein L11 methyltransferase
VLTAYPDALVTAVADGWEDRWREFHHGVTIGSLWIGPPWEDPPAGATVVVIEPGRAFGTGAHPSTRLAVELLHDERPGSLLDVGCGSGVIAIAAAKLGFGPVTAVDVDEVAVDVARANARENGVEIEVLTADGRGPGLPTADVAVVNISLELVESVAPSIGATRLITAGYLVSDRPELPRLTATRRLELDGWAADLFTRDR